MNLQLMVYLLSAFGHEAVEAHEGLEGIEKARSMKPELILLDIHMPRMDGYEVARLLRADPECGQIPIVAVTALAMVGDREKILGSGFNGYIAKPLDPEAFAAQVQQYLEVGHEVPIASRSTQLPQPTPMKSSKGHKSAVVVCVDDIATNIELVRDVLEPSGYEVFSASSVQEGLELARRRKPDLIISDIHMPHQNGYEFLRMAQADPVLVAIPFVLMSASVGQSGNHRRHLVEGLRSSFRSPLSLAHCLRCSKIACKRNKSSNCAGDSYCRRSRTREAPAGFDLSFVVGS